MVVDVAGVKTHSHVVIYVHAMWRTRMYVCVYAHMCAHVCVCAFSEIKHLFKDFHKLTNHLYLKYPLIHSYFFPCGTICVCF